MELLALGRLIFNTRFRFVGETALQDGIEKLLKLHGVAYERELRLTPKDRIDFLVGDIGLEVKVASTVQNVERQLFRYAASERVSSLLLVTTRSSHQEVNRELRGKPVEVVYLRNSIF